MQIFNLPDLMANPKPIVNYIINDRQYTFQFEWTGDHCILTAFFVANNVNQYLFKGRAITINSNLIGRVKDANLITGALFVMNAYGESVEPLQETFSSDYQLVYFTEEDIKNVE